MALTGNNLSQKKLSASKSIVQKTLLIVKSIKKNYKKDTFLLTVFSEVNNFMDMVFDAVYYKF